MKKLIIIGGGNMGYAIADGLVRKGSFSKKNIIFFEKNIDRIDFLRKKKYFADNSISNIITKNKASLEAVILAVKPKDITEVSDILKNKIPKNTLIISILAGVKIKSIELCFGSEFSVARVMPNTPCQVGKGISALTYNKYVNEKKKKIVKEIFSATGEVIEVKEGLLDIVTALSGSGPAYFCYFIESLVSSGEKLGLSKNIAYELALQTAIGTMALLENKNIRPEILRKSVTSPNGTTEAALKFFKKKNLNKLIFQGVMAARDRSLKLGKLNK